MPDLNSRSSMKPAEGGFHTRDLRLAGGISAALVSAILVGGALLAPVADWDSLSSSPRGGGSDDARTVRLADAPRPTASEPQDSSSDPSGPVLTVPGPDGPVALDPAGLTGGTPVSLTGGGGGAGGGADGPSERDRPRPVTGSTAGDGGAIDDPSSNNLGADANGEGILDQNWRAYNLDPTIDPNGDADGDGVLNKYELQLRTRPDSATTNGEHDSDQLAKDSDGDGLRNGVEVRNGTKPFEQDSNSDGVVDGDTDGNEAAAGTNPDDPASFPVPPTEEPDDTPPAPTDDGSGTDNPVRPPEED